MARKLKKINIVVLCAKCKSYSVDVSWAYMPNEDAYEFILSCHSEVEKIKIPGNAVDDFCAAFTREIPLKVFVGAQGEAVLGDDYTNLGLAGLIESNKTKKIDLRNRKLRPLTGQGVSGDSVLSGIEEDVYPSFAGARGFTKEGKIKESKSVSSTGSSSSNSMTKTEYELEADKRKLLSQAISNFGLTMEEAAAAMVNLGITTLPDGTGSSASSVSKSRTKKSLPKAKRDKPKKKKTAKRSLDL